MDSNSNLPLSQVVLPRFDDHGWIPGIAGPTRVGEGFWIRCHARSLLESEKSDFVLDLGRVADEDETYLNGRLIGSSLAKIPATRWNYFFQRAYFVGRDHLTADGENILAIRVRSVVSSRIGLMDGVPRLVSEWIPAEPRGLDLIPGFFLLLLTAVLLIYPPRTKEGGEMKKYFIFSGLMSSALQFMNSFYLYRTQPVYAALWLKGHISITVFCVFFLFRYSEVLLGLKKNSKVFWLSCFFSLGACGVPGWGLSVQTVRILGYAFALWGLPTLIYGGFLVACATRQLVREKNLVIWPFSIGAVLLIGMGGWDLLQLSQNRLPVSVPASGIGFLIAVVMAAITLIFRDNEAIIGSLATDVSHWKGKHDSIEVEAAIGKTLRQIAHDIRSPLAALSAVSASLNQLPEDKRILIRTAVSRINDIANDLLEKGRGRKAESPGDRSGSAAELQLPRLLSSWVDAIVSEKRLQFRERLGIEIDVAFEPSAYSIFVCIPGSDLKRVLSNLVNNAVEAIPVRGSVRVSVGVESGKAVIQVSDTGSGISPDHVARLFEKNGTFGKKEGSGIGLFHAREVIENAGGNIQLKSRIGEGTCVTIQLPLESPPSWFVDRLRIELPAKIIVLDDDASVHQIWKGRIESSGVKSDRLSLHSFSVGQELLKELKSGLLGHSNQVSRLFLVDFELLGQAMDGLDVIERAGIQKLSVLVTSRYEEAIILNRATALGVRLIPKNLAGFVPFEFAEVFSNPDLDRPDAVLIDDDPLVHSTWSSVSRSKGKLVYFFFSPESFSRMQPRLHLETPIYIDSSLADGVQGEIFAQVLYAQGFKTIYLATGYEAERFPPMPWIKAIVGKDPPEW